MLLADAGSKKGKSVRLHPAEKGRIFVDATDDGKSIVIVGDRVVRVDEPSSDMRDALNSAVYGPAENKRPLLVETDEDPTPAPLTLDHAQTGQVNNINDLDNLATRYGYKLVPVANDEPVQTQADSGSKDNGGKK